MKVREPTLSKENREKLTALSNNLLGLFVADLFKDKKVKEIPEEKKAQLRALVEDLKAQTDSFLENQKKTETAQDTPDKKTGDNPLRAAFKKRKEEKGTE